MQTAEFFSSSKFTASINATVIGLITPKKANAANITDFQPINLDSCIYNLLSKVLAGRLRGVIQDIILKNQQVEYRKGQKAYDHEN